MAAVALNNCGDLPLLLFFYFFSFIVAVSWSILLAILLPADDCRPAGVGHQHVSRQQDHQMLLPV